MNTETLIREALIESCKQRGNQAEIAKSFEVHPSTVKRWIDGGEIPPPMLKLLDFYFFGVVPPRLSNLTDESAFFSNLEFDEGEFAIISFIARREGVTPEQWVVGRIRSYLSHLEYTSSHLESGVEIPALEHSPLSALPPAPSHPVPVHA